MATVYTVDAIILRTNAMRESDVRITFFSREIGLADALATGAMKSTSKQRMRLEPGTITRIAIAQGKQFDRLTTSEPFFVPNAIRVSLKKLLSLQFLLGLIDETSRPRDPHEQLFDFAVRAIQELELLNEADLRHWQKQVALTILTTAGFEPDMDKKLRPQMEYFFEKKLRAWDFLNSP